MTISDLRFAAAVAEKNAGEPHVLLFDDIGCLARWQAAHPAASDRRLWVHDYATGRWIDAAAARYARDASRATPMGSGLAAFQGEGPRGTLSWDEIVDAARHAAAEAR